MTGDRLFDLLVVGDDGAGRFMLDLRAYRRESGRPLAGLMARHHIGTVLGAYWAAARGSD